MCEGFRGFKHLVSRMSLQAGEGHDCQASRASIGFVQLSCF